MPILWIILGAVITLAGIYLFLDARKYRTMYYELDASYVEVLDRAMASERTAGASEKDAEFHKQTIAMILNRPSIAALNEEQFHALINTITALVQGANKNPNQLN